MSSQPQSAASAASFAAYVPLREPCVAFASPAVQAFFARCGRMAEIKPAWLQTSNGATVANDRLREIDVPALADPTLEAIEELTATTTAAASEPTVEDILFAPFDLATLDASLVGGACSFRSSDDEVATSADATSWAADAQSSACLPTATPMAAIAAAGDDDGGEVLLIEVDDAEETEETEVADELPMLEPVEEKTIVATTDEITETETTAAAETVTADELPTLEPVEEETIVATTDETTETLTTAAAAENVTADELPTLELVEDATIATEVGAAASQEVATFASSEAPAWSPDNDGDVAVLDAPLATTEWSPEADAEAAVAVAEPVTALAADVAQPAAMAATAPAATAIADAGETTAPPSPPPVVATTTQGRVDSDLEQVQHHVLTALEQVQANLTAALDQLRAVTPPDVSPALAELRAELGRQGELLAANVSAVQQLDTRVGDLGDAVQQATTAQHAAASAPVAPTAAVAEPVSLRAPIAVAALGATWSVLLWWKTGSTALAAGTLVAANLLAGLWLGRGRG